MAQNEWRLGNVKPGSVFITGDEVLAVLMNAYELAADGEGPYLCKCYLLQDGAEALLPADLVVKVIPRTVLWAIGVGLR